MSYTLVQDIKNNLFKYVHPKQLKHDIQGFRDEDSDKIDEKM
jgi:hypothetical protein